MPSSRRSDVRLLGDLRHARRCRCQLPRSPRPNTDAEDVLLGDAGFGLVMNAPRGGPSIGRRRPDLRPRRGSPHAAYARQTLYREMTAVRSSAYPDPGRGFDRGHGATSRNRADDSGRGRCRATGRTGWPRDPGRARRRVDRRRREPLLLEGARASAHRTRWQFCTRRDGRSSLERPRAARERRTLTCWDPASTLRGIAAGTATAGTPVVRGHRRAASSCGR